MTTDELAAPNEDAPLRNEGGLKISGVTLLELRIFHCRYVIASDEDHGTIFCGDAVHRVSYCKAHYRRCYVAAKKPIKF